MRATGRSCEAKENLHRNCPPKASVKEVPGFMGDYQRSEWFAVELERGAVTD
jgi:hypothetical protein